MRSGSAHRSYTRLSTATARHVCTVRDSTYLLLVGLGAEARGLPLGVGHGAAARHAHGRLQHAHERWHAAMASVRRCDRRSGACGCDNQYVLAVTQVGIATRSLTLAM
jgi:hypothetical protein